MKMKEKNIDTEKLEIIKWITSLKDDHSIERIKLLKNHSKLTDWWDEISQEERAAIDKGLEDIKKGRVRPHSEVKKLYAKWL